MITVLGKFFSRIRKNSTGGDFSRSRINFIEGSNVTLTVADDSANDEVDITIAASAGGAGNIDGGNSASIYTVDSVIDGGDVNGD